MTGMGEGSGRDTRIAASSAECKRLRDENATGPDCGCRGWGCALDIDPPATLLDEKRPRCNCEPWAQRWKADWPELCVNCGGAFAPHTVDARRIRHGEVLGDA